MTVKFAGISHTQVLNIKVVLAVTRSIAYLDKHKTGHAVLVCLG